MATVIDGVKAPSGGFQQGGWYEGRQYWNGTLSAPGVINSQSDQVGAGKAVSAEVNAASAKAQGVSTKTFNTYLANQTTKYNASSGAKAVSAPTSAEQLPAYLDNYQLNQYGSINDLKNELAGGLEAPEPINRLKLLEEQRQQMGVTELEQELNKLKTDERMIQATTRANQVNEEGKPVALGVISGRVSEEQRQAQIDLDFINVRKATVVDELTTKYNAISTYVNYAGLDYQDAAAAYDKAFSQNLQIAQFISGEKQNAITNARANLTTIMNAVTDGNLSFADLSSEEKLGIQKLEIQSGLPVGTISRLQLAADDKILGFSDDKTQAIVKDGKGGFKTLSTGVNPSTSSGKMTEAESLSQIKAQLAQDAKKGVPLIEYSGQGSDIMSIYRTFLSADEIYAIYNSNTPYGAAKESVEELQKYKGIDSKSDPLAVYSVPVPQN